MPTPSLISTAELKAGRAASAAVPPSAGVAASEITLDAKSAVAPDVATSAGDGACDCDANDDAFGERARTADAEKSPAEVKPQTVTSGGHVEPGAGMDDEHARLREWDTDNKAPVPAAESTAGDTTDEIAVGEEPIATGGFGPDIPTSSRGIDAIPVTGASGGVHRTRADFFGLVTEKIKRRLCERKERAATPASRAGRWPASCPLNGGWPEDGLPASQPTKPPLVRTDTWAAQRQHAAPAAAACGANVTGDKISGAAMSAHQDKTEEEDFEDVADDNAAAGEKVDTAKTKGSDSLPADTMEEAAAAKAAPKKKKATRKRAAPKKKKATSEEAKQTKRAKHRAYQRARRAAMSEEERKAVNEKRRKYNRARRATQSEEEREAARAKDRARMRAQRAAQSEEVREAQNARRKALRAAQSKKQREERAAKTSPPRANESVAVDEKPCVAASEMVTTCAGAGIKPHFRAE